MAENHREREIPVFTVLKNNCILKNIFLLDSPPAISPSSFSLVEAADQESQAEEILVVGRHPDCNIKLEHPSISRFHLRIHSKPYFRSLSVTDLSSVHGTWISGKKIEPGVTVQLNEGDTLRLGASSRLYKLSWVPISCAYDLDNPFLPALGDDDTVAEETGEIIDQEKNALDSVSDDQVQTLSDTMEGLELLFSDEDSSIQKGSPASPLLSRDMCDAFPDIDVVEKISSSGISELENEISSSKPCRFDKENDTPCAHSPLVIVSQKMAQLQTAEASGMKSVKSSGLSIWSRRGKPERVHIKTSQRGRSHARIDMNLQDKSLVNENHITHVDHLAFPYNDDQFSTPDKENASPNSIIVRRSISRTGEENVKSVLISKSPFSTLEQNEEEMFTPDKENMTPNKHLLKSVKSRGILEEVKHPVPSRSSPLKGANNSNRHFKEALLPVLDKEYQNQNVLQERRSTNSSSKSKSILKKQSAMSKAREGRGPFHPLPVNSTSNQSTSSKPSVHELNMEGSRSITDTKPEVDNQPRTLENKTIKHRSDRWIIVVDTNCLLDKKSRKELQLLRGLRGTTLVIPRIVVRELDIMLRRGIFFRRTTEVSAALQWIEESMAIAKWWIRVQSSAEEGSLIPPTPPASSHHWFTEDKPSAFSVGSTPFSPYSLQEIVTPTATDHILDCALHYNRVRNDEQLVLLTDGVALKIKAMAEGVICETAGEFRRSLVNPFSTRFLYSESSPIGPSWSSADDVVLKEKYYPSPSKKLSKSGEGVKGLKLVLLHNSNFRQTTPVSSFT